MFSAQEKTGKKWAVCGWAAWFGASYEDRGQKRQFRVAGESMRLYQRCYMQCSEEGFLVIIEEYQRRKMRTQRFACHEIMQKWIHLCFHYFHCTYRLSFLQSMALCEHRSHVRHKTLSAVKRDSLSTGISFMSRLLVIGLTSRPPKQIKSNDNFKVVLLIFKTMLLLYDNNGKNFS